MIRYLVLSLMAGFFLSGCAAHVHRIEGNNVTLILKRPQAHRVTLACSLDGFQPRSARRVSGRWEVTLPADQAFTYFFRVDGVLFLPDCPLKEKDDFGSENCIFDPQL